MAAAKMAVEKKYVAASVEMNAQALAKLNYIPAVTQCRASLDSAAKEMRAAGLLDASTDPAKLARQAWLDLDGVSDKWLSGVNVEKVAGGGAAETVACGAGDSLCRPRGELLRQLLPIQRSRSSVGHRAEIPLSLKTIEPELLPAALPEPLPIPPSPRVAGAAPRDWRSVVGLLSPAVATAAALAIHEFVPDSETILDPASATHFCPRLLLASLAAAAILAGAAWLWPRFGLPPHRGARCSPGSWLWRPFGI